jgi:hypothetical protein
MLLKVKGGRHPTVRVAGRHRRRQTGSKRYTLLRMTVGWSTDFHLPRNLCTYIASPSPNKDYTSETKNREHMCTRA